MMHVEQQERRLAAEMVAAASLRAAGAEIEIPGFAAERERFDAALCADPVPESPVDALMREIAR